MTAHSRPLKVASRLQAKVITNGRSVLNAPPNKPEEEEILVAAMDQYETKKGPKSFQNSATGSEIESGQRLKASAGPKHSCQQKPESCPRPTNRKESPAKPSRSRKESRKTMNVSTNLRTMLGIQPVQVVSDTLYAARATIKADMIFNREVVTKGRQDKNILKSLIRFYY